MVRTNFAQGMHGKAERGELHAGLAPEHAATLLQAVLNGLQLQWLLDANVDMVSSFATFAALLDEILGPEQPEGPRSNGVQVQAPEAS